MAFKTVLDKIIVEPVEAVKKTASGIIIPDSAQEKPQQGKVVAVGTGKADESMEVKVGDTVLYSKYAGSEVEIESNKYLIMKQSDVLVIL
ncbi:MAG: co-chaperone GroES [Marinifilaceae bacterium]|jgi:chaperonin GroES|nr:co-chaperone GroES [Marinilabiliaceae bacterium JC040]MCT4600790.1 co-chaperone GroES [Marinifilaceae bacterium]